MIRKLSLHSISSSEDLYGPSCVVFLLVVCFFLSLTLLWRLDWFPLRPSSSRGEAKRSTLHRLLKPRTPDDCPACRLASTPSSGGGPASAPVRPGARSKAGEEPPSAYPPKASPVLIRSAPTSATPMLSSTPSSGMASMAVPSRSRRFDARPAAPRSALDVTRPCTV